MIRPAQLAAELTGDDYEHLALAIAIAIVYIHRHWRGPPSGGDD